jgi:hypothetical protein
MSPEANAIAAHIAYDGDALRAGSMDVRDLAPALLAMGDLLQHSNHPLNGDRATLAVHVRSDFKRGSFQIDLNLLQGLASQAAILFTADTIRSAKQVAEYVGLVLGVDVDLSLLGLLKRLRGHKPTSTTTLQNGSVQLTGNIDGNNNTVEVKPEVFALANDVTIRRAIADVVKPLYVTGIDTFEIRDGNRVIHSFGREDLPAFDVPKIEDDELEDLDSERIAAYEVIKPSFEDSLTWVFSDGSGGKINAIMKDKDFAERVERGERAFAKGDVLKVRMRTRTYFSGDDGLRTDHEVLEVLEEFMNPRQAALLPRPRFQRIVLPDDVNEHPTGRKKAPRRRQPRKKTKNR